MSELREAIEETIRKRDSRFDGLDLNTANYVKSTGDKSTINAILDAVISALPEPKNLENDDLRLINDYWMNKGANEMRGDIKRILTAAKENK